MLTLDFQKQRFCFQSNMFDLCVYVENPFRIDRKWNDV